MPARLAPILLLAPLALSSCGEGQADAPPPPSATPVQVAIVEPAAPAASLALTGVVRARREAEVGFRAGGRIAERLVDVGATVTAGQALARLDPGDLALGVRAAQADLAAAEATARQLANDSARSRALLREGWVSAAADDGKQAATRSAAERAVAARAALDLARNRLSYATLLAPGAGVVTAVVAEAGQVVAEGQTVLRLADPAERELLVQVPEGTVPALRGPAMVSFWARPGEAVPARLRELAPQADPALRTYAARFALPDAPDWARLGMTGTVRLAGPIEALALSVPASAVHDRGAGPMLWRMEAGRVTAVPVRLLRLDAVRAEVAGPLAAGDLVVSLGVQRLAPGEAVRVVQSRLAAAGR